MVAGPLGRFPLRRMPAACPSQAEGTGQEQAFAGHENPGAEAGVVERLAGRVLRRQFLPPHRAKAREAEAE